MKRSVCIFGLLAVALAFWVAGLTFWTTEGDNREHTVPRSIPSSVQATPLTPAPETIPSQSSVGACDGESFRPEVLVVARLHVQIPVMQMALIGSGDGVSFPVPPFNGTNDPRWSAAWWKDGAQPGAGCGVVHLDVHTYTDGSAVGNLFGNKLRKGDTIELRGADGEVARYRVNIIRTWGLASVPTGELSRRDGRPGLAIEFCWEKPNQWGDGQWRLRRYVIAE